MHALFFDAVAAKILPIGHAWMTTFVSLIAFGITGLSATTFLPHKHTSMMAAPLAGIALWPMATLGLYVAIPPVFSLNFDLAAGFSFAALTLLSIWLAWLKGSSFSAAWRSLAVTAIFCIIVAPVMMIASIDRGEPAFLNGADVLGYAHIADWIRAHSPQMQVVGVIGPAVADPTQPYSAWPELELTTNTRAGVSAFLALVSILSWQSGASFAGDAAVAVALIAVCLGCAVVFSQSWRWLLCLAAALVTCLWYDYGRSGFLPKLLSYPLVLFAFGFVISFYRSTPGPAEILVLFLLVSGAAMTHSGEAWAVLYIWLAIPLVLASAVFERRPPSIAELSLAAFPPVVAMIATGALARPLNTTWFPDFKLQWEKIVYLVTDLNYFLPEVAWLTPRMLIVMLVLCVGAWAILVIIAMASRNAPALALLCGPAVFIISLYAFNLDATAVQLAGFPYPAALCAAFLLAQQYGRGENSTAGLRSVLVSGALVALISMHIPRLVGTAAYFTLNSDPREMIARSDLDRLQSAIGDQEVYVDIRNKPRSITPIMVELGRRNVKLVWSPESWYFAASFRGWASPPKIEKIPHLRLIDATEHEGASEQILVETRRYKLVGTSKSPGRAGP